jgi:hypothetical protein
MANATRDIDTKYRENFDYDLPSAAGQKFFKGTMVGLNAAGQAGNVSAVFNKIMGVVYPSPAVDTRLYNTATGGLTVGGEVVVARTGTHWFKQATAGSITPANVGQVARAFDDQSVTLAGGIAPCGVIRKVDADGMVWVNFDMARTVAAGNGIV